MVHRRTKGVMGLTSNLLKAQSALPASYGLRFQLHLPDQMGLAASERTLLRHNRPKSLLKC